jgi:hypothetical protein
LLIVDDAMADDKELLHHLLDDQELEQLHCPPTLQEYLSLEEEIIQYMQNDNIVYDVFFI